MVKRWSRSAESGGCGEEGVWEELRGRSGPARGGVCKLSVRGHCGK